jgi:hypothetical protein
MSDDLATRRPVRGRPMSTTRAAVAALARSVSL